MVEVLLKVEPKARKQHTCNYCCGIIPKRTKYRRYTNKYDDMLYDWVSHLECDNLAYELNLFDLCDRDEGLGPDDFQEYVREAYSALVPEKKYTNDIYEQVKFLLNRLPEAERILWGKNYNFKEETK